MSEGDYSMVLSQNSLSVFNFIQEIEYISITWQSKSYFHLDSERISFPSLPCCDVLNVFQPCDVWGAFWHASVRKWGEWQQERWNETGRADGHWSQAARRKGHWFVCLPGYRFEHNISIGWYYKRVKSYFIKVQHTVFVMLPNGRYLSTTPTIWWFWRRKNQDFSFISLTCHCAKLSYQTVLYL